MIVAPLENMAAASQASPESSSTETNSGMQEIKEMLVVIQGQMATLLSDNRKIQRDELLRKELHAALFKFRKQQEEIDSIWCKQDDLEQYSRKNSLELHGIPRGAYSQAQRGDYCKICQP